MNKTPVEIFKTSIRNRQEAYAILKELKDLFPNSKINIDLDDCDRILRLEGKDFEVEKTIQTVSEAGFICELLQ